VRTWGILHLQGSAVVFVLSLAVAAGCLGPGASVTVASTAPTPTSAAVLPPYHHPPYYYNSLYTMQKNLALGMTLSLPTNLPDGFFFISGTQVEASLEDPPNEAYYSFDYHRGQDEWIFLQEQSRNSSTCPDEPVYQKAEVGKTLTQRIGSGELRWGSDGWCYILSGILPQNELETIAAYVEPVPYREGVMPPYEYQPPAHPLVRNFTVNSSFAARDTIVTFEFLRCTTDGCTANFHLGGALPPSVSPTPLVTLPPPNPDLYAEWRVDGGRPLMTMPGGGFMFNTTSVIWKIEPLPEGSRELGVNFSRVRGISGSWQVVVPLEPVPGQILPAPSFQEDPS
jgi:hypothetical protein